MLVESELAPTVLSGSQDGKLRAAAWYTCMPCTASLTTAPLLSDLLLCTQSLAGKCVLACLQGRAMAEVMSSV